MPHLTGVCLQFFNGFRHRAFRRLWPGRLVLKTATLPCIPPHAGRTRAGVVRSRSDSAQPVLNSPKIGAICSETGPTLPPQVPRVVKSVKQRVFWSLFHVPSKAPVLSQHVFVEEGAIGCRDDVRGAQRRRRAGVSYRFRRPPHAILCASCGVGMLRSRRRRRERQQRRLSHGSCEQHQHRPQQLVCGSLGAPCFARSSSRRAAAASCISALTYQRWRPPRTCCAGRAGGRCEGRDWRDTSVHARASSVSLREGTCMPSSVRSAHSASSDA